ncbi:MAG: FAD-dependent monooxygenase [Moraxella sp.]|nr:FAD-dependent monooxygenase [Moraxella sp.]
MSDFSSVLDDLVTHEPSVLVMGGGHVGLSFALLLAHHSIKSTVIEKRRYPTLTPTADTERDQYLDSRNTALSRRTVQIYGEIGLWQTLETNACRIDTVEIYEKNSFGCATLRKEEEGVESFGYVMENAHLGYALLQAVKESPLIQLLDGASVTNLSQDETAAHLTIEHEGQCFSLSAPLVVACDGQDSIARAALGVTAHHHDYGQTAIVGVVKTDKPHAHTAVECFSPLGPLALLPLKTSASGVGGLAGVGEGSYRSVVWICKTGEEARYLTDEAYFLSALKETFGTLAGNITQAGKRGAYPLVKVLADKQVVGRCVLMGNAAHTLHPVAGQGFNLCMRDADTLSSMLADYVKAEKPLDAPEFLASGLLSAYETRRLKDQKRVIFFCDGVVNGFTSKNVVVKLARNLGLLIFDKVPFVKPMVARFAMGLKS